MFTVQQIITGKRATVHLLFCIAVCMLFYAGTWSLQAAGFTLGEVPLVFARFIFFLLCIYTGRWLCLQWYMRNKLLTFAFLTLLACFAAAVGWWLVLKFIFNFINAGLAEVIISVLPFFVIGIASGILLKLTRYSIIKQVTDAQAAATQKESELNLLQSQLSPHFLFNTLNNIYSIAIDQHEQVPALLLKLSDLLRYTVYDTKKTFVPLQDELDYINNYIDFEKMRIADRLELQVSLANAVGTRIKVAPMVLIVFIENAFKHAKNTLDQKIYIQIWLAVKGNQIQFMVTNSFNSGKTTGVTGESSGLGLDNTIKRLNLLYGNGYTLKQFAKDELYNAELCLPVK